MYHVAELSTLVNMLTGAPFSSVCAETLQQTWVQLPAWVPLLCVTPPLSHPVTSSVVLSIKP